MIRAAARFGHDPRPAQQPAVGAIVGTLGTRAGGPLVAWWLAVLAHDLLRVVSVPHVPYTRWGLRVAPLNIDAGEDIRWLPRHQTTDFELAADDYWLFDDRLVVFTIFEPNGRFAGGASTMDRVIVGHCRAVQCVVWGRATPHHEYVTSEYGSK